MQNLVLALLVLASLMAGIGYIVLGLRAHGHLNGQASSSDRSIGWLFWWSFNADRYDEEGKKLCRSAQWLAFFVVAMYAAWYWVLLRH